MPFASTPIGLARRWTIAGAVRRRLHVRPALFSNVRAPGQDRAGGRSRGSAFAGDRGGEQVALVGRRASDPHLDGPPDVGVRAKYAGSSSATARMVRRMSRAVGSGKLGRGRRSRPGSARGRRGRCGSPKCSTAASRNVERDESGSSTSAGKSPVRRVEVRVGLAARDREQVVHPQGAHLDVDRGLVSRRGRGCRSCPCRRRRRTRPAAAGPGRRTCR